MAGEGPKQGIKLFDIFKSGRVLLPGETIQKAFDKAESMDEKLKGILSKGIPKAVKNFVIEKNDPALLSILEPLELLYDGRTKYSVAIGTLLYNIQGNSELLGHINSQEELSSEDRTILGYKPDMLARQAYVFGCDKCGINYITGWY